MPKDPPVASSSKVKVQCTKVEKCTNREGYRYFFVLMDDKEMPVDQESSFSLVWCCDKPTAYQVGHSYEMDLPK